MQTQREREREREREHTCSGAEVGSWCVENVVKHRVQVRQWASELVYTALGRSKSRIKGDLIDTWER